MVFPGLASLTFPTKHADCFYQRSQFFLSHRYHHLPSIFLFSPIALTKCPRIKWARSSAGGLFRYVCQNVVQWAEANSSMPNLRLYRSQPVHRTSCPCRCGEGRNRCHSSRGSCPNRPHHLAPERSRENRQRKKASIARVPGMSSDGKKPEREPANENQSQEEGQKRQGLQQRTH